jgi:large subunit ribosomal protein L22
MGARKRLAAEARKEKNRDLCVARLRGNGTSPRKTRLMADLVRGKNVEYALNVLKYSKKESSEKIRKLILSAISNWQMKNETARIEESDLYIKEIFVDGCKMIKRMRPSMRGIGHIIRKRSNQITLVLGSKVLEMEEAEELLNVAEPDSEHPSKDIEEVEEQKEENVNQIEE